MTSSAVSDDRVFTECATCGASFERDERYPARADRDDDGNVQIHSFCDEDCLAEWAD